MIRRIVARSLHHVRQSLPLVSPLLPAAFGARRSRCRRYAAQAQYKVIGADGKVTYSDREPSPSDGRVSALGARGSAPAPEPDLPFELREIVAKYPVTLYTASGTCESCVAARQLLKQRGIPFSERQVVSEEDNEALERISGSRDVPTLMIGSQASAA